MGLGRGADFMLLEDLIQRYISEKKKNPLDVNELQNFIKKGYILGELCIVEYKKLFFELNQLTLELLLNKALNVIPNIFILAILMNQTSI